MKGKSISILISKFFSAVPLFAMYLGACNVATVETSEKEFVYNRYRDGVVSKQERALYRWRGDTIVEELTILDSAKSMVNRERRVLIKTEYGLDVLVADERHPFLKFDSTTCSRSEHPMGFVIQRCFRGRVNYKGYRDVVKFTEENLITDGGKEIIYLDENFAVIDKVRIGLGAYDSVLRTIK